jgi:hypothetical protein
MQLVYLHHSTVRSSTKESALPAETANHPKIRSKFAAFTQAAFGKLSCLPLEAVTKCHSTSICIIVYYNMTVNILKEWILTEYQATFCTADHMGKEA